MQQLIFVVNPDGDVEIEADGFSDASCLDATRPFREGIGEDEEPTMKMLQNASAAVKTDIIVG